MMHQLHDLYNAVSSPEIATPMLGAVSNAAAAGAKIGGYFGQPVIGAAAGGAFALAAMGGAFLYMYRTAQNQPTPVPVQARKYRHGGI